MSYAIKPRFSTRRLRGHHIKGRSKDNQLKSAARHDAAADDGGRACVSKPGLNASERSIYPKGMPRMQRRNKSCLCRILALCSNAIGNAMKKNTNSKNEHKNNKPSVVRRLENKPNQNFAAG
jgi:hypothetical protein